MPIRRTGGRTAICLNRSVSPPRFATEVRGFGNSLPLSYIAAPATLEPPVVVATGAVDSGDSGGGVSTVGPFGHLVGVLSNSAGVSAWLGLESNELFLWEHIDATGSCRLRAPGAPDRPCVLRSPGTGPDDPGDGLCTGDETIETDPIASAAALPDSDDDGLPDVRDLCPQLSARDPRAILSAAGPLQNHADADVGGITGFGDGVGDDCAALFGCDPCVSELEGSSTALDEDGDFVLDSCDNCIDAPNTTQLDSDGDAVGDACEPDEDGDRVIDDLDNCDTTPNPSQANCNVDVEVANGLVVQGDACDPTPCTETTVTFRTERRPGESVEVHGRLRFDGRTAGIATRLETGHRFCRCPDATADTTAVRATCDGVCPIATAATVARLFTDVEVDTQPWRDTTLDYASAGSPAPSLVAGPPGHPPNALLTYDAVGTPFEVYDVDAAADWRLRTVDVPRWLTTYTGEPARGAIPGVFWSHSPTGAAPAARSGYWSGVLAEDRTLVSLSGIACAALAQPIPRETCFGATCYTAALPDFPWLLEGGGLLGGLCRGSAGSIAELFFLIGPGALPAAREFPSVPPLIADDVRWISLAEPVELLPLGSDLRLVGASLDGTRIVSQLVEGPFGYTPRGFFPGCPGGPNCPPQFADCGPGEVCLFGAEASPSARAAPPDQSPTLVLSASRAELFVLGSGIGRIIDLTLGERADFDMGELALGRVLAATYDVLRDRVFVLDEVTGRGRRTRVRLIQLDPNGGPADVLDRWHRGAATTRFALTAARDGQLYLVASAERGPHALVALSLERHGVRLTGLRIGDGVLASDRAYASDSSISYVVLRRGEPEVIYARPERVSWRGRAPSDWCF